MTIQNIPSKGRISVIKIQNFTIQRRQSLVRLVYGVLLSVTSIVMFSINPVEVVTNWLLDMREGSYVFNMWKDPTYEIKCEVWVYNYTNANEFLSGKDTKLKLKDIGPFMFKEHRTNENMRVNANGTLFMRPKILLEFLENESVDHYNNVNITVPSIAILAISTLLADKMGYLVNLGAQYSMKALDPRLFRNMTVSQYFWGYEDTIVHLANKLLPGWIDFEQIGIMDRFYAQRNETAEIELADETKKYSINTWAGSLGLKEQGFKDLNTSIPCNRINGAYEGLMMSPNFEKNRTIHMFRKQACRVYPFSFKEELPSGYGFNMYRYTMDDSAFNKSSKFACPCTDNCLPDGIIDIGNCYYGFPITLSKPHYTDVDPEQLDHFEGLHPDREKYTSRIDFEPRLGIPIEISSAVQVNIAVRTGNGNSLTKPLDKKVLPLIWLKMFVKEPPLDAIVPLQLRFVYAPPIVLTLEIVSLIAGLGLIIQGLYRLWKPKYLLVDNTEKPEKVKPERRKSNVILNMSFNNGLLPDDELAKQAVSLLTIQEDSFLDNRDST